MIVLGSSNVLWESLVPAVLLLVSLLEHVWKSFVETLIPPTDGRLNPSNARLHGVYREARSWKNAQNKNEIMGEPPDTFTTSHRGKKN